MTQLEIDVDEQPSKVAGMENATSLVLKLVMGSDWQAPQLHVEGYLRDGNRIAERRVWRFDGLNEKSSIRIAITDGKETTPPDEVDARRGALTEDESILIRESIDRINTMNMLLESKLNRAEKASVSPDRPFFCSFCGAHEDKVRHLIAGPAVFICDECVAICADTLKSQTT